jgi:phage tail protein X
LSEQLTVTTVGSSAASGCWIWTTSSLGTPIPSYQLPLFLPLSGNRGQQSRSNQIEAVQEEILGCSAKGNSTCLVRHYLWVGRQDWRERRRREGDLCHRKGRRRGILVRGFAAQSGIIGWQRYGRILSQIPLVLEAGPGLVCCVRAFVQPTNNRGHI